MFSARERLRKAGPAGTGVVLVDRGEERFAGDHVHVDARRLEIVVRVVEWALGAVLLRHLVLDRRQLLAELSVARLLKVGIRAASAVGCRGGLAAGLVAPDLLQARVAAAAFAVARVAGGAFQPEVLVVVLGGVERGEGQDGRHHGLVEARVDRVHRGAGGGELAGRGEDGGAVGRALVAELAARVERVHVAPEDVEQRVVGHLLGIVDHLDDLVVAGVAARDVVVGRVLGGAAREAGRDARHAGDAFKGRLSAPEAAGGEDRGVGRGGRQAEVGRGSRRAGVGRGAQAVRRRGVAGGGRVGGVGVATARRAARRRRTGRRGGESA